MTQNNLKNLSLRHVSEKDFLPRNAVRAAHRLVTSDQWKNNQSFIKAVGKAVRGLNDSPFWTFDGTTLHITSPFSGTEYAGVKADGCMCESFLSNHGFCWHRSAFILLKTMAETTEASESDYQIGMRFRIKGNVYKGKSFVVRDITESGMLICDCPEDIGTPYGFPKGALEYYGKDVQILSSAPVAEIPKVRTFPVSDESQPSYLPPSSNYKPEKIGGVRV